MCTVGLEAEDGLELAQAGHAIARAPKTMVELGVDVKRIARMVEQTEADAWVVVSGSRDILEWFAAREAPAFALFGRRSGFPLRSWK